MPAELIRIRGSGGEEFYIAAEHPDVEVPAENEVSAGGTPAAFGSMAIEEFSQVVDFAKRRIEEIGAEVTKVRKQLAPDKVSVAFAISIEGQTKIPFLAELGGSATVTVTCDWSLSKSEQGSS